MKVIDGKQIAYTIKQELKKEIEEQKLTPGLAIIMVGKNPASEIYVKNKIKACEEIGIIPYYYHFDENTPEEDIIKKIQTCNENTNIDGIIVQSPLPKGYQEEKIMNLIDPKKDVDGFGIYNLGWLTSGEEKIVSATPYGIIQLLERENIQVEGSHVVIVGRSKIVGRPLLMALLNRNATVTICHSKTKNLKDITRQADILIVAIGKANFIKKEDIKENAVIIDVGINRMNGKLYGDVDFQDVSEKASYITPVPGGVGPMTIAMLLSNVIESRKTRK